MSNPFEIKGNITVQDSATVLLVRRRPGPTTSTLALKDLGTSPFFQAQSSGIFGKTGIINFECHWEVLLGQSEVVNWLKTTPTKLKTMRYAGEWKLAGGNVDSNETIEAAAARELQEEFLDPLNLALPLGAKLRPFVTKQTRPIRSRSNLMHCFIALEDENPWLKTLDVNAINIGLEKRRRKFQLLSLNYDGTIKESFYKLSKLERESVTPEVREVKWVPLRDAVKDALSSMSPNIFVNEYQKESFRKYGKTRRDPMFISAAILMELEGFHNSAEIVNHCNSVDLAALTREEQWLFSGMNEKEVDEAFKKRIGDGINPSFKNPDDIKKLRDRRKGKIHSKL
jgi:ADP-ribose pyrophosphatase YjhB (NUDIX family)